MGWHFDSERVDQLEHMGKTLARKAKSITPTPSKYIKIGIIATTAYFAYHHYQLSRYRKQHVIDVFEWKRAQARRAQRQDLYFKVRMLGQQSTNLATNRYLELLNTQSEQILASLPIKSNESNQELRLRESGKSKMDIGILQLHTRSKHLKIDNQGNLVKTSSYVPFTLFGVPFRARNKSSTLRKASKVSEWKVIKDKARFALSSECTTVNYYNTLFMQQKQQNQLLYECRRQAHQLQQTILCKMKQRITGQQLGIQQDGQSVSGCQITLSEDILRQKA